MRTLGEILKLARGGERPDYDELRYALLAMETLSVFDARDITSVDGADSPTIHKLRVQENFRRWKAALDADPKLWLGPSNDPDEPEVVKRRQAVELLAKCLFPNHN